MTIDDTRRHPTPRPRTLPGDARVAAAVVGSEEPGARGHAFGGTVRGGFHAWALAEAGGEPGPAAAAAGAAVRAALEAFEAAPGVTGRALLACLDRAREAARAAAADATHPPRTSLALVATGHRRAGWARAGGARVYHLRDGRVLSASGRRGGGALDHPAVYAPGFRAEPVELAGEDWFLLWCGGDGPGDPEPPTAPEPGAEPAGWIEALADRAEARPGAYSALAVRARA